MTARRAVVAAAALAAVALAVVLLWPYLVAGAVAVFGFRVAMRGQGRRRPKSSWSSLGRTAALMYAAWNSRWLKDVSANVTVPKRAKTTPDVHDLAPAFNRDGLGF